MKFNYYQIRPCVEFEGETKSYLGDPMFDGVWVGDYICTPARALNEAVAEYQERGGKSLFWTLYGHDVDGLAHAVGDFKSFDAAYEVMCAILAPLVEIRDKLEPISRTVRTISQVYSWASPLREPLSGTISIAEDICNQSTTEERL